MPWKAGCVDAAMVRVDRVAWYGGGARVRREV